jgi:hypothetical protein
MFAILLMAEPIIMIGGLRPYERDADGAIEFVDRVLLFVLQLFELP